jgi:hypothetical protein
VRLLRKFLALGWGDRWLLGEALLHLGAARLTLFVMPFRQIARRLGPQVPPVQGVQHSGTVPLGARRIAWAVDIMSRHTPWESACLAQAIAGKIMLARRGVPALLYLGTRKDEQGELVAHAWLRVANAIVIGGSGHETFTVLAAFGESPAQL